MIKRYKEYTRRLNEFIYANKSIKIIHPIKAGVSLEDFKKDLELMSRSWTVFHKDDDVKIIEL